MTTVLQHFTPSLFVTVVAGGTLAIIVTSLTYDK